MYECGVDSTGLGHDPATSSCEHASQCEDVWGCECIVPGILSVHTDERSASCSGPWKESPLPIG
jgi:hypothetical protein